MRSCPVHENIVVVFAHEDVPPGVRRLTGHVRDVGVGLALAVFSCSFLLGSINGVGKLDLFLALLLLPWRKGYSEEEKTWTTITGEDKFGEAAKSLLEVVHGGGDWRAS